MVSPKQEALIAGKPHICMFRFWESMSHLVRTEGVLLPGKCSMVSPKQEALIAGKPHICMFRLWESMSHLVRTEGVLLPGKRSVCAIGAKKIRI